MGKMVLEIILWDTTGWTPSNVWAPFPGIYLWHQISLLADIIDQQVSKNIIKELVCKKPVLKSDVHQM